MGKVGGYRDGRMTVYCRSYSRIGRTIPFISCIFHILGAGEKGSPQETKGSVSFNDWLKATTNSDPAEAGELGTNFPWPSPGEVLSFKHFTAICYSWPRWHILLL